jgi:hypothetical protein
MKPSQCSRLKYKYYIIHDEVQKGESGSPIYILIDEKTTDILTKPLSRIKFAYVPLFVRQIFFQSSQM